MAIALLSTGVAGALPLSLARADEVWTLDAGDVLRLVAPAQPDIAGTYLLGEGGRLALPVEGGALRLGGMTLDAATEALQTALERDVVTPRVALELLEGRPFFIGGDVDRPGAYPAAPGLTVSRALLLAGGERRLPVGDRLAEAVTLIRAREEYDRTLRDRVASAVRLERLLAERAERSEIDLPQDWLARLSAPLAEDMVADERLLLVEAAALVAERAEAVRRLIEARQAEIEALLGRLEATERQTAAIEEEIADVRDLLSRGLVQQTRLNGLLREADRYQGDRLQISTQLNQARQALIQLELEQVTVPRDRRAALTQSILETEARINALDRSLEAAAAVLSVADGQGAVGQALPALVYRIARPGEAAVTTVDGLTVVAPGDVVSVHRVGRVQGDLP